MEIRDRGEAAGSEPQMPVAAVPGEADTAAPARRTFVVSGRPAGTRTRARRGVPDHLGSRPDHTAAWAVGLGMLLILVAILTAGI